MSASNAFATPAVTFSAHNLKQNVQDIKRATKRPRLNNDAFDACQGRCVVEDTSLEIDHMVLDYLAHQTIEACLVSRDPERRAQFSASLSASLSMTNAFLAIFKARHPTFKPDPEMSFRIKLLKLVTLFTQRLTVNPTTPSTSSLESLRISNEERAWNWIQDLSNAPSTALTLECYDELAPLSSEYFERNRAHVLQELSIPAEDVTLEDSFYGTPICLSLLDVLPLFMEVSAARNAMNASNLSERWMHLSCEFMLQACLEQYLVFEAQGTAAIDEAFAWGYKAGLSGEINDMFEDEEYAMEAKDWFDVKMYYLTQMLPTGVASQRDSKPNDTNTSKEFVTAHLEGLATRYPISEFERSLLEFLEALSKSIPEPVLAQLESGQLDGMTVQETQLFLAECGINMARMFHT